MDLVDLSVIVASYNTRELTRHCIESICKTTHGITFEIIVVDDCSHDGSQEMVKECFPDVNLICNQINVRYAKTNNIGLKSANGRYALLLNSDVEVQSGAFCALVKFMDEHPDTAAAGPKLINPDGSVQHCIRSFPGVIPMIFQSINFHRLIPGNRFTDQYYNTQFDYRKAQIVNSIGTTAFIIRRSTWEKYGMLDQRFTLAFVDLAYCLMLHQANQKVYYVPDAVVMHHGSLTINMSGVKEIRLLHQSLRLFYDLYYSQKHNAILRGIIRFGIRLRQQMKVLEFKFTKNKRVFGGIGINSKN